MDNRFRGRGRIGTTDRSAEHRTQRMTHKRGLAMTMSLQDSFNCKISLVGAQAIDLEQTVGNIRNLDQDDRTRKGR